MKPIKITVMIVFHAKLLVRNFYAIFTCKSTNAEHFTGAWQSVLVDEEVS